MGIEGDVGGPGTPGTDTLASILALEVDIRRLAAQRLRRIERLHREAEQAALTEVPAMRRDIMERSLRLELAAALRVTERTADALLARAQAIVVRYPHALRALETGAITERHADLFAEAMDRLTPDQRRGVEERAIERARCASVGAYRRWLRTLVDTVTAPTLTERHAEAVARRVVTMTNEGDGTGTLLVLGPIVEVHAAYDRLTRMAKVLASHDGEPRSRDQLRCDALLDLLIEGQVAAHPGTVRGIRAEVVVTVPALALLDDAVAARAPASVEGIGPIPIERARELCGGAKGWMRVLTHPETGIVLSVGRRRYRPPAALRRLVRWRSERCLAPGCGMAASRCDIDHAIPWEDGGTTAVWNLGPLCRGHHTMRHHGRWRIRQLDGGTVEWTSPLGRVYRVEPDRRTPAFRPDAGRAGPGGRSDRGSPPPF
ncbi:HNH endonuclease signature motif containing protein [Microbacterium sp. GXF7504]